MPKRTTPALSRREQQIMDIVYERGRATAREVHAGISDAPSYSTVRALLSILERKGHLRHEEDGARYLFMPTVARRTASAAAVSRLVRTFFGGDAVKAVAALIAAADAPISSEERKELVALIDAARRVGR